MNEKSQVGFCIYCGAIIDMNFCNPVCNLCGGVCSGNARASPSFNSPMFCHQCGEADYISLENPLCEKCKKKV